MFWFKHCFLAWTQTERLYFAGLEVTIEKNAFTGPWRRLWYNSNIFLMMDCVLIRIALLFTVCYGFSCWFMDQQAYPLPEMLMCACSLPTWYPSFPAVPCRWNQSHSNVRIGRIIKWKITWIDSTPLEDAPDCHWSAVFWNILKQGLHIVSSAIVSKCMFGLWYLLSVWLSRSSEEIVEYWVLAFFAGTLRLHWGTEIRKVSEKLLVLKYGCI